MARGLLTGGAMSLFDARFATRTRRTCRSRARAVSIALASILPASASAQSTTPSDVATHAMHLDEAIVYAHSHHPRIAASESEVAAARAEARIPNVRWLPRIGATVQAIVGSNNTSAANWLGSGGAVEFPRVGGAGYLQQPDQINWRPYMSTAVGIGLEQRIWDFGRTAAERAAYDAAVDVARNRAIDERLAVELAVRESYYAVLAAREVVSAADDAVRRATTHRDFARAWVEQGMRPRIELERAEADLSRFEVGSIRARGGLEAAQAVFAASVGFDAGRLDAIGDAADAADVPSLADAVRDGRARDPAIAVADARLRAQQAQTRLLDADMLPEIRAVATMMSAAGGAPAEHRNDPAFGAGFVPWVPDYFAGLVFSWRLYDGVTRARRDVSRQIEDTLRARIAVARQAATTTIQQRWIEVRVARRALPALEHALAAAEANYAQADARFRSGLGTSVELADAEAIRIDAQIQVALGRFQIARARAQFARAVAEGL